MRILTLLSAVALAVALTACGSSRKTAATPAASTSTAGVDVSSLMNPANLLDAVKSAGGLTKVPLATAVPVIEGFISLLAKRAGTKAITSELTSLKSELTSGNVDGGKVGKLLSSLGKNTSAAAGGEGSYAMLGDALAQAGQGLMD